MLFSKKRLAKAMSLMGHDEKAELLELLKQREEIIKYNKLDQFKPCKFQEDFFAASRDYRFRFLMAANRVGKSYSEAHELAFHLTGKYPEWYKGHRFDHPISAWAIGISIDSTRKVLQNELFGTTVSKDLDSLGTGTIPRDTINFDTLEQERNLIKLAQIKHYNAFGEEDGYSTIEFRSTAQGEHALMGTAMDYIWLDEEDPFRSLEIYAQCVTRTMTTQGLVTITATPENGLTELIELFQKENGKGMYLQTAKWTDAPHLSQETIEKMKAAIPSWQLAMRSEGIPVLGSGMVYEIDNESISIDPIVIPDHWRRACGVDIGFDHQTAAVWTAYDADNDTIYVTDIYAMEGGVPSVHASAINARGKWIPVILPHDSQNTERGSGMNVAQYYEQAGVNALPEPFYNPITWDGKKNRFVEPGLMEIRERMLTGRFKVFSHCKELFVEKGKYHRKEGKIVKKDDDIMDAMRYSAMSVTHRGISKQEARYDTAAYDENWNTWNDPYGVTSARI